MAVRKRLIFWLVKAYIKKSGKVIVLSFLAGLLIFFTFLFASNYISRIIPLYRKVTIGIVGAYTKETLPPVVMEKLSKGLTTVDARGKILPAIASSWEIRDSGKTYVFHLRDDQYFSNGRKVTSDLITYDFSDVNVERPDKSTIVYKLTVKDPYAPFLVTVSRPIFQNGFTGVGTYKIQEIKLNGDFIQSLTLVSAKNRFDIQNFQFYPTQDALKLAYMLGEVNEALDITIPTFHNQAFADFSNTEVKQVVNRRQLVTLFYNTTDSTLSDKRLRLGLNYALPKSFAYGEKTFVPYPKNSLYFNTDLDELTQDYSHAKLLLEANNSGSGSASTKQEIHLTMKTLAKYRPAAENIVKSWAQVGVKATIEEVDSVPREFQVYLGDFNLSKDPDQYPLWHSGQPANIMKYKNLRIDKLLEDGRKTVDPQERIRIYNDFQKYLIEDAPAAFLYFPYEYEIVRK
jgi:peptide/nickel transport system substrate-binding protein